MGEAPGQGGFQAGGAPGGDEYRGQAAGQGGYGQQPHGAGSTGPGVGGYGQDQGMVSGSSKWVIIGQQSSTFCTYITKMHLHSFAHYKL